MKCHKWIVIFWIVISQMDYASYFLDIYLTFDHMTKFDINGEENIQLTTSGIN